MADRAHVRSGAIIKRYNGEKGWMTLEDGRRVSPILVGFEDGNDSVLGITVNTVDNSTGPDTVTTVSEVVGASAVTVTRTIRDKTAQELSDENDAAETEAVGRYDVDKALKALAAGLFEVANDVRVLKGQGTITRAQFINYLKTKMADGA